MLPLISKLSLTSRLPSILIYLTVSMLPSIVKLPQRSKSLSMVKLFLIYTLWLKDASECTVEVPHVSVFPQISK